MRRIKEQWERRLADEELEHQRGLVALQSQHALQLQSVKAECQQAFDQQVSQAARELQAENDRLRRESEELRQTLNAKLAALERERLPVARHEELLSQELQKARAQEQEHARKLRE